nr:hypothetical protein Iba_chr03dCG2210 [Ipomoea batatas]
MSNAERGCDRGQGLRFNLLLQLRLEHLIAPATERCVVDDQFANGELMLEVNGDVCGENNTEWLRLDHRVAESSKFWLDGAVIRQGLYQGVVWIVSEDNWCDFSSTNGVSAKSENSVWISSD